MAAQQLGDGEGVVLTTVERLEARWQVRGRRRRQ